MQDSTDPCTKLSCNSHFQEETAIEPVDALTPLTIRGVTLPNRVGMAPMCQYSAQDGYPNDWHFVHLGSRAAGGCGLIFVEATAVQPEGRITPGDTGLWDDDHQEAFARIARFIASQGTIPGIQLAHAGRKASCQVPWLGGAPLGAAEAAWQTLAPSAIPFAAGHSIPKAASLADIRNIVELFAAATKRAIAAGFQVIELHAAHGYLLHEFLSPLSNQRTDQYGGSLENRMRLVLETAESMRGVMPESLPLFVRLSCTDWTEGGWDLPQSIELAKQLKSRGVDVIDCSSGAIVPVAKIPVGKGYQVPFAAAIKREAGIRTAAVGMITEPLYANEVVVEGQADIVLIGRELLREPYFVHRISTALNEEPKWPTPYGYAVRRRQTHATAQPREQKS
jgi:2,4-dienoyl-CoA reductase-like NADH-dependent reductase (Old Yellow Enzyme family)